MMKKHEGPTRIIVAGGRNFDDYSMLKTVLDEILSKIDAPEIVSGHARGADLLGERYAAENNIPCMVFTADWKNYPIKAGFIRNTQMIEYVLQHNPMVIAFWDGVSHGTGDIIKKAENAEIERIVVCYDRKENQEKK